jgi:hypothetical protein
MRWEFNAKTQSCKDAEMASRNRTPRSVWSAWSLLPLLHRPTPYYSASKLGALQTLRVYAAVGLALCLGLGGTELQAQTLQPGQAIDPDSLAWPRFYATNGYEFAVYQPQISAWPGNQLEGRLVVAVRPAGTTNESYGVVFFKTRTDIDKVNRLVTFEDFKITRADFPTQKQRQAQYMTIMASLQQQTVHVIPLDHLEAVFAASGDIAKAKIQAVKNDPPRVIYTTQPALLILVDGAPILKPLMGNYQRVVNTRPVLLLSTDPLTGGYYLYADANWYASPSIDGP